MASTTNATNNSLSSLNNSSNDNASSPYYIHHSDNPGLVLVSQPLNVSKEAASVIYSESIRDMWIDLKERFRQRNGPRIFQLRHELMNLNQGQMSVGVYFTKLKTLWEELSNYRPICSCGKCVRGGSKKLSEHYQMEYVMSFLMGLNDTYAQVWRQLLLMDPIPFINKVFSLVSQEEHQRSVNTSTSNPATEDSIAFYTKIDPKKGGSRQMHNKFQRKERPMCTYCGIAGHSVDKCYKLHGYPPGYKMKQKFNDQVGNQSRQVVVNQVTSESNSEQLRIL
ncbi:uncharacterized protein LOC111396434 [Olea europaea var. sylvestris]|uniref:uncharacterized protein LOC111396434 n=1 Tax=Olea europaea var. sylvestris TaxID=158386 RepID=UPI000C1D31E4|nr:uncharacterized protein LOC111396434 [Olea europaea var. sylvestris]